MVDYSKVKTGEKLAFVPLGQGGEKPGEEWKSLYKQMREQPDTWPRDIPSFELWCAMTLYDVSSVNGGDKFQKLMHLLLTEGTSNKLEQTRHLDMFPKIHYGEKGHGEGWTFKSKRESTDYVFKGGRGSKGDKQAHTSKTAGMHKMRGADHGGQAGENRGFNYKSAAETSQYSTPTPVKPYSRLNWMQMMSLKQGDASHSRTGAQQFITDGKASAGQGTKCEEMKNCMAVGNTLAALYGLYFYPNCRNYDWTVTHKGYTVRMRMWNPRYELISDKHLFIQEPLNEFEVNTMAKPRMVGGQARIVNNRHGMTLPVLHRESQIPMEPNHLLMFDDTKRTRLAPFFVGGKFDGGIVDTVSEVGQLISKEFEPLAFKPKDGLMWGWNCPKAHWLYPHWPPTIKRSELKVVDGGTVSKIPGGHYQAWPTWKKEWRTPADRQNMSMKSGSNSEKFYQLLNWGLPPLTDLTRRREFALNTTALAPPPKTKHAPSVIQQLESDVDVDEEAEIQRLEAGEEDADEEDPEEIKKLKPNELRVRLREKGLSSKGNRKDMIDRLLGTTPQSAPPGSDVVRDDTPETNTMYLADQGLENTRIAQTSVSVAFTKDVALNAMTDDSLAEHETGLQYNDSKDELNKKEQFNRAAQVNPKANLEALEPGEPYSHRDENPHFKTYADSPWPHSDIYYKSEIKIVPEEDGLMDEDAVAQYEAQYGSTHNLYLRGERTPVKIKDIEQIYGDAEHNLLATKLTYDSDVHRKNLCRILAIYFWDGNVGYKGCEISHAEKQRGMLEGVYGPVNLAPMALGEELRLYYGKPPSKGKKEWKMLWSPVFKSKPDPKLNKTLNFEKMRGDDSLLKSCMERTEVHTLKSDMTVLEWITTPWHYNFLPYQPEQLLFRDGETYSEGCRRCARPFYENEFMYMWYRLGIDGTQGWPLVYWSDSTKTGEIAPQPFHSEQFWSKEQVTLTEKQMGKIVNDHLGYDNDGGWHNWKTYDFLLTKDNPVLKGEWHKRFTNPGEKTMSQSRFNLFVEVSAKRANFRQYYNLAWNEDRKSEWGELSKVLPDHLQWGDDYSSYPQSRCSRGKVRMGMRNYKLQRASKYGNVCRDCAATLEYAPGLFHRNHRILTEIGVVKGKESKQKNSTLWWSNMIGRMSKEDGEAVQSAMRFDPDFFHGDRKKAMSKMSASDRRTYNEHFRKGMDTLADYFKEQHQVSKMGNRTKHTGDAPDVYIQKVVPGFDDSTRATDNELIQEAVRDLKKIAKGDYDGVNRDNSALKDMINELERKYVHLSRFERDPSTRTFDSDMMRLERRNVTRRKPSGEIYYNCLEISTYQPKNGVIDPTADDYETVIYYANRIGLNGEAVESGGKSVNGVMVDDSSMWEGDGYVSIPQRDKDDKQVEELPYVTNTRLPKRMHNQWRPMRQSRMFITYSLHRPVTSELEARVILEKMAKACHEIFGNDYYLSQILIFGYKLAVFGKEKGQRVAGDKISGGGWEVITGTKKEKDMQQFYGEGTNTSYIYDTYETHVDKVTLDAGCEIGPQRKHPHFHALVTLNHWTYLQIDYFKMNQFLEQMFKGVDFAEFGWGDELKLPGDFYSDAENPHVDIRVYPQDNWKDIIAAYVRKNATPGIFESIRVRMPNVNTS